MTEYDYVWHDGQIKLAHRVIYEQAHGPIPEGMLVDHIDRNKSNITANSPITEGLNLWLSK